MNTQPSKFWAYIAVIAGVLLILAGLAALVNYFGLPIFFPVEDALSDELGQIAAIYLGLLCGSLAVYHGINSIRNRKSSTLKLPSFYIFWIILGLALGLGTLTINADIVAEFLFPPVFILGAALSTLAVLAWADHRMGFPITWRQASLAFVCGSTLSIIVTIILGTTLPYLTYLLLEPLWYLAEGFAEIGWGAPGFIERLFASPLILVFLAVTAVEAPIPEEFAKALGIPMFGRARIQNERQAFAIGLASGAGFAVLENMLYEGLYASYNGWGWAGITLLRSIGSVLHPIGTGIIALGWFRMRDTAGSGAGKLLKAYLLSVGLHTLWNGGFEPLVYLTGLEYFAGEGPSLSIYGETLSALLVGYLILLSAGLWWLLRRIVNQISERVAPTPESVPVSRRAIATWAVACALVIVPIGATLSPAWNVIRGLLAEGRIGVIEPPQLGSKQEVKQALAGDILYLEDFVNEWPTFPDVHQPGDVYQYKVTLNNSAPLIWEYEWCALTVKTLYENLGHIEVLFLINGSPVPTEFILTVDNEYEDGTACRSFSALVTRWFPSRHELETQVTLTGPTDAGWSTFPAGTHYFRYTVTVKQ